MFVNKLNQIQREALFDLAINLAASDNDVSPEEILYLEQFSEEHGIPLDLDKENINVEALLKAFNTRESQIILLQELIKVSYKDGHFGDEERDNVFMIAEKMGLNESELFLRIDKWVREGFDWAFEGEQMLMP